VSIEKAYTKVCAEVQKVFFGQEESLNLCLAALFCGGHVLLEGVPGTAKTLLVQTLATTLSMDSCRIQMTADRLPNEITGFSVYHPDNKEFTFKPGPVFTNFLLADELNRASPKTQSALLEAMQEGTVSQDKMTHPLPDPFMVFATQNPIDQDGTYPLPLAQLDRFMFKIIIDYPDAETEKKMLNNHHATAGLRDRKELGIEPVLKAEDLLEAREIIRSTFVRDEVVEYVQSLMAASRDEDMLSVGASPRAGLMLMVGAKSIARFAGRDYVIPDDIKQVFCPAMRHRVVRAPIAEIEEIMPDEILTNILETVKVPR